MHRKKSMLVRNYLRKYKRISSMYAIKRYWYTRLSDLIYKLKKRGWQFRDETLTSGESRYKLYIVTFIPEDQREIEKEV